MRRTNEEDDEVRTLQLKLLTGRLAATTSSSMPYEAIPPRISPTGGVYTSTIIGPSTPVTVDPSLAPSDFHGPADVISRKTMAPHKYMVEYIYNKKDMYSGDTEAYNAYMATVQRGEAALLGAQNEAKRSVELDRMAVEMKGSLLTKLATVDRILDDMKCRSIGCLAAFDAEAKGGSSLVAALTPVRSRLDRPEVPPQVEEYIEGVRRRQSDRATAAARRQVKSSVLHVSGLQRQPSVFKSSLEIQRVAVEASATGVAVKPSAAATEWFEGVVDQVATALDPVDPAICVDGGDPSSGTGTYLIDASAADAALEKRIETLAVDAGLLEKVPSSSTSSPQTGDGIERFSVAVVEDANPLPLAEAELGNRSFSKQGSMRQRRVSITIEGEESVPSDATKVAIDTPVMHSSVLTAPPLQPLDTLSLGRAASPSMSSFSIPSSTLQRNASVAWASKSCSCESTFHMIKQKIYDDVKRALRVRYLSAFVGQIDTLAMEVIQFKDETEAELQRLRDVMVLMLKEKCDVEMEYQRVQKAMEQLTLAVRMNQQPNTIGGGRRQMDDPALAMLPLVSAVALPVAAVSMRDSPLLADSITRDGTQQTTLESPSSRGIMEEAVGDAPPHSPVAHPAMSEEQQVFEKHNTLRRRSTAGGGLKVQWKQFMERHTPVADTMKRLLQSNASMEKLLMLSYDVYEHRMRQRRTTSSSAGFADVGSEFGDTPPSSLYHTDYSPISSPRGVQVAAGLRIVSARLQDSSTQTLSDEDYLLENIESVMTGGSHHQSQMAHLAASTAANFDGSKRDMTLGSIPLTPAEKEAAEATKRLELATVGLVALDFSSAPVTNGIYNPDVVPSFAHQMITELRGADDALRMFLKDVIAMRPRRPMGSQKSISALEIYESCVSYEDSLQLKLRSLVTRVSEAYRGFLDTSFAGATEASARKAALEGQLAEAVKKAARLDDQLHSTREQLKELQANNVSLETKFAKLVAQQIAEKSKGKQQQAKSPQAEQTKEQLVARHQKQLDEVRGRISALCDAVKQTLQTCCETSNNHRLAMALQQWWSPPETGAEDEATSSGSPLKSPTEDALLIKALDSLKAEDPALSCTAFPDPSLLQLNHELVKGAEAVMNILRLNKIDVPLSVMDFIEKSAKRFFVSDDEIDGYGPSSPAASSPLRKGGQGASFAMSANMMKCLALSGLPATELLTTALNQIDQVQQMMQVTRKALPLQRRQLITPFLECIKRLVVDAKEDVKINSGTVEWYLKKKKEEKHLLEGEDKAVPRVEEVAAETEEIVAEGEGASPLSKSTKGKPPPPEEDCDDPFEALRKKYQSYRTAAEGIADLLSDKRCAITAEATLGQRAEEFAVVHHAPFAATLRRNAKDVLSRMEAIIAGKNLKAALNRDACEGTPQVVVEDLSVQATTSAPEMLEQSTEYLLEDYEPPEGDEDEIQMKFEMFEKRVFHMDHCDPELEGFGEDYIGVPEPDLLSKVDDAATQPADAEAVAKAPPTGLTPVLPSFLPKKAPLSGSASLSELHLADHHQFFQTEVVVPAIVRPLTTLEEHIGASVDPTSALAPSKQDCVSLKKKRKTVGCQTSVDSDKMDELYGRLPLTTVFVLAATLVPAVEALEDIDPVCGEIQRLKANLKEVRNLFSFRRAKNMRELGVQLLFMANDVVSKLLRDIKQRPKLGASVRVQEAAAAARRVPMGVDSAIQSTVAVIHKGIMVEGNGGHCGFTDDLADEEALRVSFVPLFAAMKEQLVALKLVRDEERKVRTAHAPVLEEGGVSISGQVSEPSEGNTTSRPGTTNENQSVPGTARDFLSSTSVSKTVQSTLQLEKNIIAPLRRSVFRFLNEPPFALPPERGQSHPLHRLTAAGLRAEIAALGTVHATLQKHSELSSSYRRTLLRLVGVRFQMRKWEAIWHEVEGPGLLTIEEQSKNYKFLTARPPVMNARARREEQARLLQERTLKFKELLSKRTEGYRAEVARLEKISLTLRRQHDEQLLLFLREFYFPTPPTGGATSPLTAQGRKRKSSSVTATAVAPPSLCPTVIPPAVRSSVMEERSVNNSISGLLTLLWGGGGNWSSIDDDPRARSWYDRTASQGGARGVRFDETANSIHSIAHAIDASMTKQPGSQALMRQAIVLTQADLERMKKPDYLDWSTCGTGLRTVAGSQHSMYASRKSANVQLVESVRSGLCSPPPQVVPRAAQRPLHELEDEFCGGVTVRGWKGGLVHLDNQPVDEPPHAVVERSASATPPPVTEGLSQGAATPQPGSRSMLSPDISLLQRKRAAAKVLEDQRKVAWLSPLQRGHLPPSTVQTDAEISGAYLSGVASLPRPQRDVQSPPKPRLAPHLQQLRKAGAGVTLAPLTL